MTTDHAQRRRDAVAGVQREQILEGFARAFAQKGYAATTIADIARAARVSKSTFYAHFADKEAVFLSLHTTVRDAVAARVAEAVASAHEQATWQGRVRHVIAGYLDAMASNPLFLVQLAVEASAAAAAMKAARDEAMEEFADALVRMSEQLAGAHTDVAPLSLDLARAALAGFLELVYRASLEGPDAFREIEDPATELFTRLLHAPGA